MESFLALFHPLVIHHFPIALLLVAGALELVRFLKPNWNLWPVIGCNILLGTAGALASVVTGWFRAGTMGFSAELRPILLIHRWAGAATLASFNLARFVVVDRAA